MFVAATCRSEINICYLPDRSKRFQEQGHSFSPSGPTLPVNNRFIFLLKIIKLQAMRLCHFNFLLETFLN